MSDLLKSTSRQQFLLKFAALLKFVDTVHIYSQELLKFCKQTTEHRVQTTFASSSVSHLHQSLWYQ